MADTNEGSPWFWKIFGGTILGMVTFLLLAHINNINSSIDKAKTEGLIAVNSVREDVKEQRVIIDGLKDRMLAVEQSPFKTKIDSLEASIKEVGETVSSRSEKLAGLESSIEHFKEEIKTLREESAKTIEGLRTENTKLVEQMQLMRDRITALENKKAQPNE